jgi:chemotaxis protein MotB
MSGSLSQAFGVQAEVTASDTPMGTSLEVDEFSPALPKPTDENEVRQHAADSDRNILELGAEQRLREIEAAENAAARQAEELRTTFSRDIDEGRLLIRQEGSNVVIQLLEKDSFPSGSAALEPASLATLARIGALVGAMPGAITVSGHTDNVPIRSGGAYRSNWELSAARAASVGHELLGAGLDPARLMVSGHADTQPRAANDTPANRALNRRVDITFASGRDRPGVWSGAAAPPAPQNRN